MRLHSGTTIRSAVATIDFPEAAQPVKKTSLVLLVAAVPTVLGLLLAISVAALILNRRRTGGGLSGLRNDARG